MARSSSTMAMVFFMSRSLSERGAGRARRPHLVTFQPRSATKASRSGRQAGAKWRPGPTEVTAMIDAHRPDRTYAAAQFGNQNGERWRRFLERIGTHSNDFAVRLSRAR